MKKVLIAGTLCVKRHSATKGTQVGLSMYSLGQSSHSSEGVWSGSLGMGANQLLRCMF